MTPARTLPLAPMTPTTRLPLPAAFCTRYPYGWLRCHRFPFWTYRLPVDVSVANGLLLYVCCLTRYTPGFSGCCHLTPSIACCRYAYRSTPATTSSAFGPLAGVYCRLRWTCTLVVDAHSYRVAATVAVPSRYLLHYPICCPFTPVVNIVVVVVCYLDVDGRLRRLFLPTVTTIRYRLNTTYVPSPVTPV